MVRTNLSHLCSLAVKRDLEVTSSLGVGLSTSSGGIATAHQKDSEDALTETPRRRESVEHKNDEKRRKTVALQWRLDWRKDRALLKQGHGRAVESQNNIPVASIWRSIEHTSVRPLSHPCQN